MGRGTGIDVGAEMVKVVQARARGTGLEVLAAASFSRHSLGVDGSDVNALALAAASRAAELGFHHGAAVAGITGKDVILRYMSVPPAPLWKLHQLMDYEVGEITGEDPGGFAYDFRPLNLPQRAIDEFLLMVAVARNEVLEERLASFAAGRIAIEHLCPDAAALFNVFARCVEADPREYVVLLDVGAEKTEVVFMRNQSFVFARSVMPGGREFSEAIAETLDVSAERAEEIKQRRGAILPPEEIAKHTGHEAEFYDALAAAAGQLVRSVQSTLMFARTQTKLTDMAVSRYYLCGGGARLGGLRERLAEGLGKPVEWLDLSAGASGAESVAEQPSSYGVALGLAIAAARPDAFALRLVPARVARRRRFRRKGVFACAAALLALLVAGASALGTVHNWRTARNELADVRAGVKAAEKEDARCEDKRRLLDDRRRKIHLLSDQVRANALAIRTLNTLRQQTPDAIGIQSVRFGSERSGSRAMPSSPTGDAPARYTFVLKGVATKRGALDASEELDEFVRLLSGAPILAKPLRQARLGTPTGGKVDFEIVFSPSEPLIEERADGAGHGG